jgi:spore maturation protein CgeB
VLAHLDGLDDERRERIGSAARARVLAEHTAEHRAAELEEHVRELLSAGPLTHRP